MDKLNSLLEKLKKTREFLNKSENLYSELIKYNDHGQWSLSKQENNFPDYKGKNNHKKFGEDTPAEGVNRSIHTKEGE